MKVVSIRRNTLLRDTNSKFKFPEIQESRNRYLKDEKPSLDDHEAFLDWFLKESSLDYSEIYQSYDGWYNNKDKPNLGSTGSSLSRLTSARYQDGVGKPLISDLPNPFHLSSLLSTNDNENIVNRLGKNALLVFFGEHVTNEIVDTRIQSSCPPEYFDVEIPSDHEFKRKLGRSFMPFIRGKYSQETGKSVNNPRKMISDATPYIDGGTIYGRSKMVTDQLRSFESGRLRSDISNKNFPAKNRNGLPNDNEPIYQNNTNSAHMESVKRFYATGDYHANENPFLLAINIMWFRWHNLIADKLRKNNRHWDDEKIFNTARKWVIASQQQVIINEWLPIWTGKSLTKYNGYKKSVDPSVSHLFSGSAMRYGHVLVPPTVKLWFDVCDQSYNVNKRKLRQIKRKNNPLYNTSPVKLCNSFFSSFNLTEKSYKSFFLSLTVTSSRPDGASISKNLRRRTYGPIDFTRRDLASVNIQRGRDFGLPDYLSTRSLFNLPVYGDMYSINSNLWNSSTTNFHKISTLYKNVNDIDVYFGGLMESNANGIGETFREIINEQFTRIRDSDYFWYQNRENKLFDDTQIKKLELLSIRDILTLTLNVSVQEKPFLLPNERDNFPAECGSPDLIKFPCQYGACFALSNINTADNDEIGFCPNPQTFDYMTGSEFPLFTTIGSLGLYVLGCWLILWILVSRRKRKDELIRRKSKRAKMSASPGINSTIAFEWESGEDSMKPILINFELKEKRISIKSLGHEEKLIRRIDFKGIQSIKLQISVNSKQPLIAAKIPNEHDLIVTFDNEAEQTVFVQQLEAFLESIGVGRERQQMDAKRILKSCYSKHERQKHLESFFRAVFAHSFDIKPLKSKVDLKIAKNILQTELTEYEFAEALAMRPDSLFVKQMFSLVDKDENGYISFREFLDMMIIFAKGSSDQKAKLMFDMYDLDGTGSLSKQEFSTMIRSMLELANQSIDSKQMEELISSMFTSAGLDSKNELNLTDFLKFLGDYKEEFGYVELNLEVGDLKVEIDSSQSKRQSAMFRARDKIVRAYSIYKEEPQSTERSSKDNSISIETQHPTEQHGFINQLSRFIDETKWHIFWFLVFFLIIGYLLIDKLIYYTYFNEDRGLRQIAGFGVAISRGTASVIMFIFSILLITMSRNLITVLRETFLNKYIPFDASVSFHKIIAIIGLIFAIIHSIGHTFNFYHILTQRPSDLMCLFPSFYSRSNELPKFQDWCFHTITGVTGLLLLALMTIIYIFSTPVSRRYVFTAFWSTHNLYPLFYLLMFLHGLGRLIQEPLLTSYLIVPLVLFKIDKLISISRKKSEIPVVRVVHYPSNVTLLCFAKPENFDYKSGQWVRISSVALNSNEFHPFTLASAPHEENLQLYIRAVGPFTTNIRQIYDPNGLSMSPYPNIRLDGPYGETHQDWFRFPVSVLVGGGIGVTPFASILKDVAFKASINRMTTCKKVYFLWVTRTQKHFEWLVDILRDLEEKDVSNLVCVHIFITQFYDKFDLRTMMLYVCERHFQRVSNRSLFTGLKAKTQFGRPDFHQFFTSLQRLHPKVARIGVFSCGPPPMTNSVGSACERMNRQSGALFIHHSENF
uniref:NAD(P)H oxidase (H2O2-forming) n=1 Tax=Tetranychus urticae TaxID=32264 RepID=T1KCF3_TETUR